MYLTSESEHEYRFGTHGPKYLTKGERVDLGVVVIGPGEEHPCHMHVNQEESFLAQEGKCDVYVNGEKVVLKAGDYLICEPGDAHFFHNPYEESFKSVFVKAPHLSEKDSVYIDWKPGQPFVKPE